MRFRECPTPPQRSLKKCSSKCVREFRDCSGSAGICEGFCWVLVLRCCSASKSSTAVKSARNSNFKSAATRRRGVNRESGKCKGLHTSIDTDRPTTPAVGRRRQRCCWLLGSRGTSTAQGCCCCCNLHRNFPLQNQGKGRK